MDVTDQMTKKSLDRSEIEAILREEEQFFIEHHQRMLAGRESEDIVENAYSRIRHMEALSYETVANIYDDMK